MKPPHEQPSPTASAAEVEHPTASTADQVPDGHADGAKVSAVTCAGVANLAPSSRGGQPGRSGPPGHRHSRQHGGWRAGIELKELSRRGMDGRTTEAREVAAWIGDYASDLGGIDNLTTAQVALLQAAGQTWLQLGRVDAFIAGMSSIANAKRRQLYPIVQQRATLANTLRQLLGDLGLERRTRDVGDFSAYLAAHATQQATPQPAPAPSTRDDEGDPV